MAERDFVEKLEKVGFESIEIMERRPFGIEECAMTPLFTDDLLELMRKVIPPDRQHQVAVSVVIKAALR